LEDQPVQTFDEQVKQHFRWNFTVNAGDFAFYIFALSFASQLTILPAFVSKFTSSKLIIGMVPAIHVIGWQLPQILSARYIERFSRRKRYVITVGIGERLPWLFIALTLLLLADAPPLWGLLAFFILYSIFCFSGGVNTPAWLDMIGKIIPERKRGRFFGLSNLIGNGVGVGGALIAGYLLENLGFPVNFAACFMLTFIFMAISIGCLALTKEPAYPIVKERSTLKDYVNQLAVITRSDRNYFLFLIAAVILSFSAMSTGFFAVRAISRLNLSGNEIGRFTAISLFFQTAANPLWGYLGDRWGHKRVMEAGAVGAILSALIAAFADSASSFYVVFAVTGAWLSAAMIARLSIVLEFSEPEERPTYIGLTNTIRAPFSAIAPVLGGILGDRYQLRFVFLLTAVVVFVGLLVLMLGVKEPRNQRRLTKR
jgi:MFS family permease